MAKEIIWEFRGKTRFRWLQKSGCDHTEVWLNKGSAEGEAGKSQKTRSKLHAPCILRGNQICSSKTGDSEGTPAAGLELVTFNIRGGIALSLKLNPTSWWSTEQVHRLSLRFGVIQLPYLAGRSRKRVAANRNLSLQAGWTELSQGTPLRIWAWDQLSKAAWIHYPLSQRTCR